MRTDVILKLLANDMRIYRRERLLSNVLAWVLPLVLSILAVAFPARALKEISDLNNKWIASTQLEYPNANDAAIALIVISRTLVAGILMLPAIGPPLHLACSAITSEKEQKTLECLLLLPASDREILASKIISSSIFSALGTWAVYIVIALFASNYHSSLYDFTLFEGRFLFEVFVLVPSLALLSTLMGIIISINASNTKTAFNLTLIPAMIVIPIAIFLAIGAAYLSWELLFIAEILVLAFDFLGFAIAKACFNRERMLLRY